MLVVGSGVAHIYLTDEQHNLLESFAAEQGIKDLADALPAMIHELVRLHDELWDKQFAASEHVLERLNNETLAEYHAGLTEDFDFLSMISS